MVVSGGEIAMLISLPLTAFYYLLEGKFADRRRKKMNVELNLPLAFAVEDYHDFDYAEKLFGQLSPKLKVWAEVAFGPSHDSGYSLYWGVVYIGRKPGKNSIIKALLNAGWVEDSEDSESKFDSPMIKKKIIGI
jgi:hypothetical protein